MRVRWSFFFVRQPFFRGFATARGAEGDVRSVRGAKVAVFAAGIDAAKTETKGVVRMTTAQARKAGDCSSLLTFGENRT